MLKFFSLFILNSIHIIDRVLCFLGNEYIFIGFIAMLAGVLILFASAVGCMGRITLEKPFLVMVINSNYVL